MVANELGKKIKPISLDLSNVNSIKELEKILKKEKPNIKFLINNAGYAKFCSYCDLSIEDSLNMIDLNIKAVVGIGLTCIPYMKPYSHIINIASQASFFPLPYQNIYSSTKVFVKNYTRALNVELKDKNISATAVCPGWMQTDLYVRGNVEAKKKTTVFSHMKQPNKVAAKALVDAIKNKDFSTYGAFVRFTHLFSRMFSEKAIMKM
ncbi:MAG: SDR family NAD(P)-dependent oxidoreductase [Mycoplasmoidaceae bacterium]|nr:SDR family NAD(P)-dependent oxidoreductase [Mycoplasmoidaceae bacterium]